jgi:hypothetical protein
MGTDPDGRFVLVITETGQLRQYFTGTGGIYTVIADSTTFPGLEFVDGVIERCQHSTYGRVWFLPQYNPTDSGGDPLPANQWITYILEDLENNGVFESITPHLSFFSTSLDAYYDPAYWTEDFINIP